MLPDPKGGGLRFLYTLPGGKREEKVFYSYTQFGAQRRPGLLYTQLDQTLPTFWMRTWSTFRFSSRLYTHHDQTSNSVCPLPTVTSNSRARPSSINTISRILNHLLHLHGNCISSFHSHCCHHPLRRRARQQLHYCETTRRHRPADTGQHHTFTIQPTNSLSEPGADSQPSSLIGSPQRHQIPSASLDGDAIA